ncbi:MAG: methyltransferase domain-containing protein [Gaiellaceae bacterium]
MSAGSGRTPAGKGTRSLEETYCIERKKWDEMAQRAFSEANLLPPHVDFEDLARKSGMLIGVADFFGDLKGKRVLEYGCGLGKTSVLLAKSSAEVSAFDLSPISVEVARTRAKLNGLELDLAVAAGEKLPYPDESFDVVFGRAILHHLDVGRGWGELYRVLKPGGKAAFVEPMGMNPILNFVRDHVPYPHKTPRGADRPLTYKEIRAWGKGFSDFRFREIQFLSMLERMMGFNQRFPLLRRIDNVLLERLPFLRRYCRYVIMYMVK